MNGSAWYHYLSSSGNGLNNNAMSKTIWLFGPLHSRHRMMNAAFTEKNACSLMRFALCSLVTLM